MIEILRNELPLLFFQNLENQRDKEREDRSRGGGEEKKGSGKEGEKQKNWEKPGERPWWLGILHSFSISPQLPQSLN